jgi:signal transduction histidine kinase
VSVALRELGPTLTWLGSVCSASARRLTALIVSGRRTSGCARSSRRRARSARAHRRARDETGGDEVSALRATFNRMAADLESRATALAESDRARRQLLADVSHELMTPLSAIRGYVETLGMPELPLDQDTRKRYLDIVDEETHKLEAIIGDLLDLARLEGGGDTLRRAGAVDDLFKRVADRHEPRCAIAPSRSTTTVAPGTPRICGDAGSARAGAAERRRQRDPAHAGRRHVVACAPSRRRRRAHHRPRHRPGHSRRAPAARLRSLLQGGCVARRHRRAVGQRPRPVDRPRDHRTPRRHGHRRQLLLPAA